MKIVRISWTDPAFSRGGWMDLNDFKAFIDRGASKADTVGFLAHETADSYTIIGTVGVDQVGEAITINKSCVQSFQELGESGIELILTANG